ncbi:hypothetical protein SAMN05421543_1112 [Alicyclobacillus macrosporangiidus]|uniref:Uncharacterized protein n=1 Tax=Alicyclobacillus macrosporangiidus TaxID=392015 RepID=A0A1I7JNC4_9BACL|nr:hypothetical protein SAMN05421543_1112 [Alicyclobacillus macrosporangiidus]
MNRQRRRMREKALVSGILRAIDIWIAILLLTGQLTCGGVFLASGAIWLSLAGPITGSTRMEGQGDGAGFVLDAIDVIIALLLITGQITNTGPWISSGKFNFVVTGPVFGNPNIPVAADPSETSGRAQEFFSDLRSAIIEREIKRGPLWRLGGRPDTPPITRFNLQPSPTIGSFLTSGAQVPRPSNTTRAKRSKKISGTHSEARRVR